MFFFIYRINKSNLTKNYIDNSDYFTNVSIKLQANRMFFVAIIATYISVITNGGVDIFNLTNASLSEKKKQNDI